MGLFNKAVKQESKLRMAITGPSGSGKTYTSLAIAAALANGAPIAVVDTEHGSASKYADLFAFDVADMHPPFHPDKFIKAIQEAADAGYAVIILDSISHAWAGTGGVLDIVDEAAKRSKSGNTYMAWKEGTPVQNKLIDAIVQSGIHVIATMRSKTEYVLADTGNGKQAPRKVGMAPVQRDQFEYEFDVVLDMDIDNNAIVSKTRCPALTGRVFAKPGADVADILAGWLHGAATQPTAQPSSVTMDGAPTVSQDGPEGNPFDDKAAGATAEAPKQTPPHRRLFGIGQSVFGKEWDAARPWLLKQYTKRTTPRDIRESAAQLSDDEKTALGDYIHENAKALQDAWATTKANRAAKQVAA